MVYITTKKDGYSKKQQPETFDYVQYLLEEILQRMDDTERFFLKNLLS